MKKRRIFFSAFAVFLIFIVGIYAQGEETTEAIQESPAEPATESGTASETGTDIGTDTESESDILDTAAEEIGEIELEQGSGITPDSRLYFLEDQVLSRFRDDVANREKKIAEVKEMIEQGKIDDAKRALERYDNYANNLEKEIDPEKRDEARRSAVAIRNAVREFEREIPDERRKEFVDDVLKKEGAIVTAAEIANKIKALCEQLSNLDPSEYARVCKTSDDAPDWQKRLDRKLTAEQREEAKKFGQIMESCFRTQGRECKCNEIPFLEFAATCSIAAPLATLCSERDEEACDKLDSLEIPELPDYLQDVMDDIEKKYGDASYDNHIPKPCREAGITGRERDARQRCMATMIEQEAPEECREELKKAIESGAKERDLRELCEDIMFRENAPEECVQAGARNPKECARISWEQNTPQECKDAGLTGESSKDVKKCREIMENLGRGRDGQNRGERGFAFGHCARIENPQERLMCFDDALGAVSEKRGQFEDEEFKEEFRARFEERFRERTEEGEFEFRREGEFRERCEGLSPEECEQRFREEFRCEGPDCEERFREF